MEQVILVDESDNELGYEEKLTCHKLPVKLHRAFSIFIFNGKGQVLLQRRAKSKHHWGGFWSNTCCSHPRPDEPVELAAKRRLEEEIGIVCDLQFLFKFIYKADYDTTWGEHELDWVFVGYYDGPIKPNEDEIDDLKFVDIDALKKDMSAHPERYTPWFKICLDRVLEHVGKK
ncbi:MAG: isopentenyl-diphosphate Delta-isomerase [Candidatus Aenigmarchaeota archaeon]|nr:isopentenyl-diphosphate Delta-isomerase [Candidatus Aenigmarchaeota archaeon]